MIQYCALLVAFPGYAYKYILKNIYKKHQNIYSKMLIKFLERQKLHPQVKFHTQRKCELQMLPSLLSFSLSS